MANFLTKLKKKYKNLHSLTVSLLLAIWYNGISSLINLWFPGRGFSIIMIMLLLPLVIFLIEDGGLDELYKDSSAANPATAAASSPVDNTKKERFYTFH